MNNIRCRIATDNQQVMTAKIKARADGIVIFDVFADGETYANRILDEWTFNHRYFKLDA